MKILFLDSPAFAKEDMLDAFSECNIEYDLFFHEAYNERKNAEYEQAFDIAVSEKCYDFVFSFNYYPILSNCCMRHNLKYVAYVYDSPLVSLYSCSLINSCNYVFIFDKATYEVFRNAGITTVYYLPLAANVRRLSQMETPTKLKELLQGEVSFVGSLYNEEHNFFDRLTHLSDYTKGYLDAIMSAQQKLYGSFILEQLLYPNILEELQASVPYTPMADGTETAAFVYANYFLARKLSSNERLSILKKVSEKHSLNLFTHKPSEEIPLAKFKGTVDYYSTMPLVFKNSSINLNISLRSIHTGIPLRCMDIMGSGSFLLTNFQADFFDFFLPGEDYVYYESEDDCLSKIDYYLNHKSEQEQICANALGKMRDAHTFRHRIETILSVF